MSQNQKKDFSIEKEKTDGMGCHFTIRGQINALNSVHMELVLTKYLDTSSRNIILDMHRVPFLSSAGIRVILQIHKKLSVRGGRLRIKNPSENVRNVLGMIALDEMLLT